MAFFNYLPRLQNKILLEELVLDSTYEFDKFELLYGKNKSHILCVFVIVVYFSRI